MKRRIFLVLKRFARGLYRPVDEQEGQRRLIIVFLAVALVIAVASLPLDLRTSFTPIYYVFVVLLVVSLVFAIQNRLWPAKVIVPLAGFAFITRLIYGGGIHLLPLADIDHFKKVNDRYGHQAGDQVLQMISNMFRTNLRAGDLICRYGGEEFLLVLPGMKSEDAKKRAEKLRSKIEALTTTVDHKPIKVTISIGGAIFPENGDSTERLIYVADHAMYRAKQSGRNRVEFSPLPDPA